jgi:hypothetical protein
MTVAISVILRKFKKDTKNAVYRKNIAAFLDILKLSEDVVKGARLSVASMNFGSTQEISKKFKGSLG